MGQRKSYLDFIKENGRSVSELNSGSLEKALSVKDTFVCLELLRDSKIPVYGGDILSEQDGKLIYAYQLWGDGYHYLNWSCDKEFGENEDEFIDRSYEVAKNFVVTAAKTANEISESCYIVLVI